MSKSSKISFQASKKELQPLFKRVILYVLLGEYLADQRGEAQKEDIWYKKFAPYFSEKEIEIMVREAEQILNEYLEWIQIEEIDWLAKQESDLLKEVLAEEDHLDFSGIDIFRKVNRRLKTQKSNLPSLQKINQPDD